MFGNEVHSGRGNNSGNKARDTTNSGNTAQGDMNIGNTTTNARDITTNSGNSTKNSNNRTDNYKGSAHNEFKHSTINGNVTIGAPTPLLTRKAVKDLVRTENVWNILSSHLSVIDQDEYRSTISPFDWDEPRFFWITRNLDFTQWKSADVPRALLLSAPHGHGTTEFCSHFIGKEKASRTNRSVLYFFYSRSAILTHTLLHQIVRCSDDGKANSIAAAFLSTLVDQHFQRHSQVFPKNDSLDTTVEKILEAPDDVLIGALSAAIEEAGIQELWIIADGLRADIACSLVELIMEAIPKSTLLLTSRHSVQTIPSGMVYIEYDKERNECLRFLQHDDTRYDKISKEHHGSLEWLWEHPQYLRWSTSTTSSLLYIEGKPGSGKSTLAKYFMENLVERVPNARSSTLAHYFYTFRGTILERTHENMLRSLLHGILKQDESAFFHFQQEFRNFPHDNRSEWPNDSLKKVLSSFAKHPSTKPIYLIIDAMDESEEKDRRSIIQLLCELCSKENPCNIKVFLANRPLAELKHRIEEYHHVIKMQDQNEEDISRFADDFLNRDFKLTGKILRDATDYITEHAQGVFVWVALVKSELISCFETGYTNDRFFGLLRSLPLELEDFYDRMFDRLEKRELQDIEDGIMLFRFAIFMLRPLTVEELGEAIAMRDDHTSWDELGQNGISAIERRANIERRISHCGGNFLEIKADGTVQFMHQTARDFLIRAIPDASNLKFDISGEEANGAITITLIRYLTRCVTSPTMQDRFAKIKSWGPREYRDYAEYLNGWPLIDYALRYIEEHRDLCSQNKSVPELITALVRQSTDNLASYFLGSFVDFRVRQNNRQSTAAKATYQASYFLGSVMSFCFGQNKYKAACEDIKYNTLNAAAEPKLPHAWKALLLTCTQENSHAESKSPLILSAQKGLIDSMRLLLDQNLDKDAQDNSGRTALHYAAENGDEAIVRLLVEHGASDRLKDKNGKIALELAVKKLYVSPALLLLVATMYA
ncbi:hypothetical protein FN846DRAFT_989152 [Sphaerosporella brunnea]|uniref:NACHT domain-containing protein n=1 Tax=Sphaerosporella brunnea TaxID=1250544 RepID=A0A5J5EQV7_9PEZI|nr:hypothetical protein FN846DRAFT_989152 [Sphaerosporella brunnea]